MRTYFLWVVICLPAIAWAQGEHIDIARFSQGDLNGWQTKGFAGETYYVLEKSGSQFALRADSSAAASGRYREVSIDLNKTPILNWMWKVDGILAGNDERTRKGDDYPARLYVVFSGGTMFWRTRAINYVWSNKQPIGSSWPNAFTERAHMIAIESGPDWAGQWVRERRDVRADYRRAFGEEPGHVDAVAIMTDTDNTGLVATAWYGDIWFTDR